MPQGIPQKFPSHKSEPGNPPLNVRSNWVSRAKLRVTGGGSSVLMMLSVQVYRAGEQEEDLKRIYFGKSHIAYNYTPEIS